MSNDSVLQLVDPIDFARCLFEESNDALPRFDPASLQVVEANVSAQQLLGTGAMVAGIAHEVNQPRAAMSKFASAAQQELNTTGIPANSPLMEWMTH